MSRGNCIGNNDQKKADGECAVKVPHQPVRRDDQIVGNPEEQWDQQQFQCRQSSACRDPVEMSEADGTDDAEQEEEPVGKRDE